MRPRGEDSKRQASQYCYLAIIQRGKIMKIKDGVIMQGLQLEMRTVLQKADALWKKHGKELVITSALDGTHSAGSYHYFGYALDFRTRYFFDNVPQEQGQRTVMEIVKDLQAQLGDKYTVLFESTHIHVQYNASLYVR